MKQRFFRSATGRGVFAAGLLVLLALCGVFSLTVGAVSIPWQDWNMNNIILREIRLPRTILGIFTGAVFAVSGAILQGIMRNPLASPGILGVSAGGGLAGLLALLAFPGIIPLLPAVSFAGSFLAAILVYLLAWKRGIDPVRLILSGVAVSAMLNAFSSGLLLCFPEKAGQVLDFAIGSLAMKSSADLKLLLPYMILALTASFLFSGKLNILELGDETASNLGLSLERDRIILLALASLLAGTGVSAAGLLGFVGLIAPHIVRFIIGSDHRYLLPCSALAGGALVVFCDTAGRILRPPTELPAGLMLALLGPVFFLWLLRREHHHA